VSGWVFLRRLFRTKYTFPDIKKVSQRELNEVSELLLRGDESRVKEFEHALGNNSGGIICIKVTRD
jgi:hypothetical protein